MVIHAYRLYILIICVTLFLLSMVALAADVSVKPENTANTETDQSTKITLTYDRIPFDEVVAEIEQQSNIKIEVVPALQNELITTKIRTADWKTAIDELLKGYNRVGFINKKGETSRILVTGVSGNGKDAYSLAEGLFSYEDNNSLAEIPDHLKSLPTGSVIRIKFNKDMLKKMSIGETLSVSLPAGRFNIVHDNLILENEDEFTWIGYLEDITPKQRVILSFDEENSFGRILTPEGVFRVETSAGIDWLIDVDNAGLNPGSLKDDVQTATPVDNLLNVEDTKAATDLKAPKTPSTPFHINAIKTNKALEINKRPTNNKDSSLSAKQAITSASSARKTTIDVMVLYTDGIKKTRITNLLNITNQAYIDSQVNIHLRLVQSHRVNYTRYNLNQTALNDLSRGRKTLSNINKLRKKHGADLVTLIRPFNSNTQQGCGIAWLGGAGGRAFIASEAFSVIGDGIDDLYYCSDYSFAHEISHNMGSNHDRHNARYQGRFPYSFGYNVDGRYGTVMSYSNLELGVFSNPAITCTGQPCGVETDSPNAANNALSLSQSAASIAAFMKSAPANSNPK